MSVISKINTVCNASNRNYALHVEQLFAGTMGSFVSAVLASCLISFVSCARYPETAIFVVSAFVVSISLGRVFIILVYRSNRKKNVAMDPHGWERIYATAAILWMFSIGVLSLLAFQSNDLILQLFVVAIVFGSASSLAGRNASRPRIVTGQLVAVLLPLSIGIAMNGTVWYIALAACSLLLGAASKSSVSAIFAAYEKALNSAHRSEVINSQFNAALENMNQGLVSFSDDMTIEVVNDKFRQMFNIPESAISSETTLRDLVAMACAAREDKEIAIESLYALFTRKLKELDGKPWFVASSVGREFEFRANPTPNGVVVVVDDVTERMAAQRRIETMAHYDSLTGLPNRALLLTKISEAFTRARGGRPEFAVLFADLDKFKEVNDTLGHSVGDELLKEVASRMRDHLRETDLVARVGGDEFVILLSPIEEMDSISILADRIVAHVSRPYNIRGYEINVGLSVGSARALVDGASADEILKNADMALYKAKEGGRRAHASFRPEMRVEAQTKREKELDLRRAIQNEELVPYFQPIMDIQKNRIVCCEALVRWNHPTRGLVFPGDFIAMAENTGLIVEIGAIMLKKACAEAMKWSPEVTVAVNLSPIQFKRGVVVEQVMEALLKSGLPPHRLEVEITESLAMDNFEAAMQVVARLRELGVKISLDDFGTGYTSLSYLNKIPFDKVKVDRAFVQNIATQQSSRHLVEFVGRFVRSMGKTMVVEGVETQQQLDILRGIGVSEIQGFLFGKPKPGSELPDIQIGEPDAPTRLRAVA